MFGRLTGGQTPTGWEMDMTNFLGDEFSNIINTNKASWKKFRADNQVQLLVKNNQDINPNDNKNWSAIHSTSSFINQWLITMAIINVMITFIYSNFK